MWLAPLSSEASELIVAAILSIRGDDETALGTLLSSNVSQWTLLVGSLPIAHAFGGSGLTLRLDARQNEEFILTAAQALFAVTLLLGLKLRARDALLLFTTFAAQFSFPPKGVRLILARIYGAVAVLLLIRFRTSVLPTLGLLARNSAEDGPLLGGVVGTTSRPEAGGGSS